MVPQDALKEGKKLILDHQNYICHEIIQKDYPDGSMTNKLEKSTQQLLQSNKTKNLGEFSKSILQVNDPAFDSANEAKISLIKSLHQLKVDFR